MRQEAWKGWKDWVGRGGQTCEVGGARLAEEQPRPGVSTTDSSPRRPRGRYHQPHLRAVASGPEGAHMGKALPSLSHGRLGSLAI